MFQTTWVKNSLINQSLVFQIIWMKNSLINQFLVLQTTWVKKAAMKVLWQGKEGTWYDCTLELERGVGDEMDGMLTLQFKLKHKHKVSSYISLLLLDWKDILLDSRVCVTISVKTDGCF